jgi:heme/copper-type cytochrome/quinol oxidase subunit 4
MRVARSPRSWLVDSLLYGAAAAFAGVTAAAADIPLQRSWGRMAVWPYGAAAVLAACAGWLHGDEAHHRRRRIWLATVVFAGAAIVPLVAGSVWRSQGDPGDHAQSEVIIVEEAANASLDGHDPYAAEYREGPLSDRPLATQVHFPYLPGMLVFGLPRALAGHVAWADARVWFAIVALAVAIAVIRRMDAAPDAKIRTFQVLFALPTGALLLATGGVDIPVVALLFATFVLAQRGGSGSAGLTGGLALAMKQTSILVLPFVVFVIPRGAARRRFVVTTGLVGAMFVVPFALWDWGAFVEDTVLFPLGLGHGASAAATPTLGSMLLDRFPSQHDAITVVLVSVIAVVMGLLLFWRRTASTSQACMRAGGAFLTAIALAPAARAGYLVYPVNLIVWAIAFRGRYEHVLDPGPRPPSLAPAPNT